MMTELSHITSETELEKWFANQCKSFRGPALVFLLTFLVVFSGVSFVDLDIDFFVPVFGGILFMFLLWAAFFRKSTFNYKENIYYHNNGFLSSIYLANIFGKQMYVLTAFAAVSPFFYAYLLFADINGQLAIALLGFPISYLALSDIKWFTHLLIAVAFLIIISAATEYTGVLPYIFNILPTQRSSVLDNGLLNLISLCVSLMCSGIFFLRAVDLIEVCGLYSLRLDEIRQPPPFNPRRPPPLKTMNAYAVPPRDS
ncbi:hypothetical protein [Rhizobium leguminosarum]|uniref:hypothetical protein n=1 Tax=Rhizobium leguminosarum TaxID=384 RepID=UPI001C97F844|nr:hypothetical protein [Rhizobium leguminosarum]MBY5511872.1 hypothetical protein [Rhizobium leguminosarum]